MAGKPPPTTVPGRLNLMPQIRVAGNLFHSITEIPVDIDTDPANGEIYPQGGGKFSLHAVAIKKIANSAGIRRVESRRVDDRSHPYVCEFYWRGEWLQPDGVKLELDGTYLLDLRDSIPLEDGTVVRGARWDELYTAQRLDLIDALALERTKTKTPWQRDQRIPYLERFFASLGAQEQADLERDASAISLRQVIQMRPHIVRRAETGAMTAAMRTLLRLKSHYTIPELKQGFVVYRTRIDTALMKELLGEEDFKQLATAAAAQFLGISVEQVRRLPSPTSRPAPRQDAGQETPPSEDEYITLPWRDATVPPDEHPTSELDRDALVAIAEALGGAKEVEAVVEDMNHRYGVRKFSLLTYRQAVEFYNSVLNSPSPPSEETTDG